MLRYDLQRVFDLRGISRPYAYLIEHGFTITTSNRLLSGKVNGLNLGFVEKLCILLKCTPNDLLSWTPGKNEQLPPDLPIKALTRSNDIAAFAQMRSNLPLDELEKKMNGMAEDPK
jgi:hypothetical protein